MVSGLPHGTVIENLARAALNETFRLSVEIDKWAGEGHISPDLAKAIMKAHPESKPIIEVARATMA